ncbi:MAG: serine hydrolase domain-containing protein [Anaerolineae bacterium]
MSATNDLGNDTRAIERYVETEMKRLGIPGLALGIVRQSQIYHLQGFGVADSAGRCVTPDTPFHIGSLTKSFTALAIMQLVEAGQIELDMPVQAYLPWFTLSDADAAARLTVRHLLNQSSGLSETDGNCLWTSTVGMEEAVRQMRTLRLCSPVGTKYQYCNLNYVVLGLLVEQVSGQAYGEYVSEHIFKPLGMDHSYTSHTEAREHDLAAGHYYALGRAYPREGIFPPAYLPTGLLISSAEDLSHYVIAQLNAGRFGNVSVLSSQGMAELHAPAVPMMPTNTRPQNSYAMGWAIGPLDGVTTIRHSGDIGVSHGEIMFQPASGWGVILLANVSGFEQLMQISDMAKGVLSLLNGHSPPGPVSLPVAFRGLYWGIPLTLVLQIFGIVAGLISWQSGFVSPPWQVVATIVLNLAIALLCLFKLPGLIPFPLASLRAFYPEVGYALIAGATLGVGWSVVYAGLNLLRVG